MERAISTTAIMIFSLSAKEEACRKPLFKNTKDSGRFYQSLLEQTEKTTQNLEADIIWIDGRKQKGYDFASRFSNAFSEVFALGYDQVIAIGNDSPELTPQHLCNAIKLLDNNTMVAGPAVDGGVYLLGLHKTHFKTATFECLPWQQKNLYTSILNDAREQSIQVISLDSLHDIDALEDALAFASRKPLCYISVIVKEIFSAKRTVFKTIEPLSYTAAVYSSSALRAPPAVL